MNGNTDNGFNWGDVHCYRDTVGKSHTVCNGLYMNQIVCTSVENKRAIHFFTTCPHNTFIRLPKHTILLHPMGNHHQKPQCLVVSRFGLLECARCFAGVKQLEQPCAPVLSMSFSNDHGKKTNNKPGSLATIAGHSVVRRSGP